MSLPLNIFKCELSDGSIKEFELSPVSIDDAFEALQDKQNCININKESLIQFQKPDNMSDSCWFKIDSKNKALYFNYGTCIDEYDMINSERQSNVDFKEFNKTLTTFINNSNSKFDKVIIDLRGNTGGHLDYFDDIINNNLSILKTKKVYALIGKKTFSAGTVAANTATEKCSLRYILSYIFFYILLYLIIRTQ